MQSWILWPRHEQIVELREEPLDVLVIGGGIVGGGCRARCG